MDYNSYSELQEVVEVAQDRLITGEGPSGIHYQLMHILKMKYGVVCMSREEAIRKGQKLCDEYIASCNS